MAKGTLLQVLQRQADGWWYVRVVSTGQQGWALSRQGNTSWIECCQTTEAPKPIEPPAAAKSISDWNDELVAQLQRNKNYPVEALNKKEEGTVIVSFTVDRSGNLVDSAVDQSSGSTILDQEAIAVLTRSQPFPPLPSDYPKFQLSLKIPIRFNLAVAQPGVQSRTGQSGTVQQGNTSQSGTEGRSTGQSSTVESNTGQSGTGQSGIEESSTVGGNTGQSGQSGTVESSKGQSSTVESSTGTGQSGAVESSKDRSRTAESSTVESSKDRGRTAESSTGQSSTAQGTLTDRTAADRLFVTGTTAAIGFVCVIVVLFSVVIVKSKQSKKFSSDLTTSRRT
jgi:TonB family protein